MSARVAGVGMLTAVGAGARQTAASVRAGVARFTESPIFDKRFEPIVMATVPEDQMPPPDPALEDMPGLTARQIRMLRLAAPSLKESVADLGDASKVPLLLATPEPLPNRPDPAGDKFLDLLARESGVAFDISTSRIFPNGRAGGFLALEDALERLESGDVERVIVGGVDSHRDLYLLATLDAESRLLTSQNSDGFVPGEGSAFLVLTRPRRTESNGHTMATIVSVGTSIEEGHRYSDEAYRGEGLSAALEMLFAHSSVPSGVGCVFAGFNGENLESKEWGVACLRHRERLGESPRVEHPVDCFGDTGAALAPLLLGLATMYLQKGTWPDPCLAWCASDRGQRGAALVRRMTS
jgi:3-oxoacyl-[acyl-carrier-protein] synthase I